MNQRDLFSVFDDCERTRARESDPDTSVEAAHEVVASGTLSKQCQAVLNGLRRHDGSTSAEIGQVLGGGDRFRTMAGRRMSDLAREGFVRRGPRRACRVNGTNATTWWVIV